MSKKFSLPIVGQNAAEAPAETEAADNKTRAEGGDVMSEIAHEVKNNTVVIYMKGSPNMPQCGFSARASQILSSFGIPYHHVNILADPEKRQAIKEYSQWPTIPQIYVGGEFLGGSDILMEMYQNGELQETIEEAFNA